MFSRLPELKRYVYSIYSNSNRNGHVSCRIIFVSFSFQESCTIHSHRGPLQAERHINTYYKRTSRERDGKGAPYNGQRTPLVLYGQPLVASCPTLRRIYRDIISRRFRLPLFRASIVALGLQCIYNTHRRDESSMSDTARSP